MPELAAAYHRIDDLKASHRELLERLETLASTCSDFVVRDELAVCINIVEHALSEMVVA